MAIDRIFDIADSSKTYIPNTEIDWSDYFDDFIGVTKLPDSKPEEVILHFYGISGKYVENKPIHGSQKSKWLDKNVLEVKLKLIFNYELLRLILSYGESVKLISPESINLVIRNKLYSALQLY